MTLALYRLEGDHKEVRAYFHRVKNIYENQCEMLKNDTAY